MMKKRVLFMPDGSKENPYQKLLKEALIKKKVKVEIKNGSGIFKIINEVKRFKPKILHLHWIHNYTISFRKNFCFSLIKSFLFLIQIFYLKFKKIKIVWTVHNLLNHEKIHIPLEYIVNFIAIRFMDAFILHSKKGKEIFIKKYKIPFKKIPKIYVIPHGNYINFYKNEVSKEEARKKFNLKEEFVILYLGSLRKYKGIIELIDCFKEIRKKNFKLIIGGKPYSEIEKREIEEKIKGINEILFFPFFIKDEEIQFFYNASDVVVFPFKEIFTSGSLICAMGFKKALILPEFDYLLEEAPSFNFFYSPFEPHALKKAIERAYSERDRLEEIGRKNFLWIKKRCWDNIADAHLKIYNI
ncbi:MAG: glycosyltransferase [candidate division WOR-3 bacterium]